MEMKDAIAKYIDMRVCKVANYKKVMVPDIDVGDLDGGDDYEYCREIGYLFGTLYCPANLAKAAVNIENHPANLKGLEEILNTAAKKATGEEDELQSVATFGCLLLGTVFGDAIAIAWSRRQEHEEDWDYRQQFVEASTHLSCFAVGFAIAAADKVQYVPDAS